MPRNEELDVENKTITTKGGGLSLFRSLSHKFRASQIELQPCNINDKAGTLNNIKYTPRLISIKSSSIKCIDTFGFSRFLSHETHFFQNMFCLYRRLITGTVVRFTWE